MIKMKKPGVWISFCWWCLDAGCSHGLLDVLTSTCAWVHLTQGACFAIWMGILEWQCNTAKVWVLWVPVSEQRDDVGYTDKAVELEARTDRKTPTSRNIQELKEQMVFTEDDINLLDATGIEVPGPVPASQCWALLQDRLLPTPTGETPEGATLKVDTLCTHADKND